mgnify:CR=1 FL=1
MVGVNYSTHICSYCHSPFTRHKSSVIPGQRLFCSRRCYLAVHESKAHYSTINCKQCQKIFLRAPSEVRLKSKSRVFCSRECYLEYGDDLPARFWEHVQRGAPDECWCWEGALGGSKNKYGDIHVPVSWRAVFGDVTHTGAHRVAFFLHHGHINNALLICHFCDNPPCINWRHLFQGTIQDNACDMVNKGRSAKGDRHPSRLYPEQRKRGENNPRATLTADKVREARMLREAGWTFPAIAKHCDVGISAITFAIKRQTWKHIP